ncbi:MAG: lytic transglycosylase domain-containing protein [Christensenellales bacterium]|jgi:soluble lytic murein transglycosylase
MGVRYSGRPRKMRRSTKRIIYAVVALLLLCAAVIGGLILKDAAVRREYPLEYTDLILKYSKEYSLDPVLVASLIRTESRFRTYAESRVGALGLMQVMPETGEWIAGKLGIDNFIPDMLIEPEMNIQMGCWYLYFISERFEDTRVMLAAYNAGHNAAASWLKEEKYSDDGKTLHTIPYPETDSYVDKVMDAYDYYLRLHRKELLPDEE